MAVDGPSLLPLIASKRKFVGVIFARRWAHGCFAQARCSAQQLAKSFVPFVHHSDMLAPTPPHHPTPAFFACARAETVGVLGPQRRVAYGTPRGRKNLRRQERCSGREERSSSPYVFGDGTRRNRRSVPGDTPCRSPSSLAFFS